MKKAIVNIARVLVGALFIFSGFVKLNDPLGFSYKLEEYFGADVLNLEFLIPYALMLAVFIVIYELLLGITLLIGYAPKFTRWSLLLMIGFFTFLTFYSAYFNKVTDCGCFGDAIPLTPWQSFYKDVVLSILILIIFFNKKYLKPIIPRPGLRAVFVVSFVACLWFANHVLAHLPAIDFRAYKIGTDIQKAMEIPEGAAEAEFEYRWTFEVNGKEEVLKTSGDYPDSPGEFIGVETVKISDGYEAPIHDFSLQKGDEDFTKSLLNEEKLIIISAYNLSKSEENGWEKISELVQQAKNKSYKVIGLSASSDEAVNELKNKHQLDIDFYFADETAIKTIVRSNPGIVVLEDGVIKQKWHWNDTDKTDLN
ncbi:MAG: BT_3928 family protein [Bacteroidota bacterium]